MFSFGIGSFWLFCCFLSFNLYQGHTNYDVPFSFVKNLSLSKPPRNIILGDFARVRSDVITS
jgi:hypothetical protein